MRILVVSDDLVFPTNSGGRSEVLNLSEALIAHGHTVGHVMWAHAADATSEALAEHRARLGEVWLIPRASLLKATATSPSLPYQLSSRDPKLLEPGITAGGWDVVLAHHEWTLPSARRLADAADAPLLLRSHNDEVAYFRALAADGTGARRLYFRAELARIKAALCPAFYEGIGAVLTIADGDAAFYRSRGVSTVPIGPSLFARRPGIRGISAAVSDAAFVGALDIPHAVSGLRWFIDDVLSRVRAEFPDFCLHVAGRRPNGDLARELARAPGVQFHGEIPSVDDFLTGKRIFINPVFSGSGVNMKMGPPIQHSIPIVTTRFGAAGFQAFGEGIIAADSADDQAEVIKRLVQDDAMWSAAARALEAGRHGYTRDNVVQPFARVLASLVSKPGVVE